MKTLIRKLVGRTDGPLTGPAEPYLLPSEREAERIGAEQKALHDEVAELEARRKELEGRATLTEDEALSLASIPPRIRKLIHAAQAMERGLAHAKSQARLDREKFELPCARAELLEVAPRFRAACERLATLTRNEGQTRKVQAILVALREAGL